MVAIATLADGVPAYARAAPRLRQTTINLARDYGQRLRELLDEEAMLSTALEQAPQPSPKSGISMIAGSMVALSIWGLITIGAGLT